MAKASGQAQFVAWMGPVLDSLRTLGGKARPAECISWIATNLNLPVEVVEARNKSGPKRFSNQVHWARKYLVWEGLIDASQHGMWSLTAEGAKVHLSETDAREIFLKWTTYFADARKKVTDPEILPDTQDPDETQPPDEAQEQQLLAVLQALPPKGFEAVCRRLLIEHSFENVVVTGGPHDEGIDGIGILRLNPFVALKVMFQCKRIRRAVSRKEVGEFRNAMLGRADKGIFLTTSWFSADAEREANRDGVPPIELVDGDKLVELFESKHLGLRSREVFEVDHTFFAQFRVS